MKKMEFVFQRKIYERIRLILPSRVKKGYVYENLVAQMLIAAGNELFYHSWPTPDGKHNYEIDFLLSRGNKLCPLEVKSSGYKTHASLDAFQMKFSERILNRYLVYTKDLAKDQDVVMLPVFMVSLI